VQGACEGSPGDVACNPDGSETEQVVATDLGAGLIEVHHYCLLVNCCGSFTPELLFDSVSTITVNLSVTYPSGEPCRCDCRARIQYNISGLTDGVWTIRDVNTYLEPSVTTEATIRVFVE
jgi:hypothetical protein